MARGRVLILKGERLGGAPSAFMRGDQLAAILKQPLRRRGVSCEARRSARTAAESTLVLNKNFLIDSSAETLVALKARGNRLMLDLVDMQVREDLCRQADVLLASSVTQLDHFRRAFPDIPSRYLAHHADLRIGDVRTTGSEARAGYFGFRKNGLHLDALAQAGVCDLVPVENHRRTGWIGKLKRYRCHYAVRSRQDIDGFKPFTKGATAAACGAAILVERDEETARQLGGDYPFFADSAEFESVRDTLRRMRDAARCDTRDWRTAHDRLGDLKSRCTPQAIGRAFADIFDEFGLPA